MSLGHSNGWVLNTESCFIISWWGFNRPFYQTLLDLLCRCRLRNKGGLLRTPRGLNNPKMGLLSFSSFWGILVQGTFLPPNGSISNITGWKLVYPASGEIPRLFWIQKIRKSPKWGPKFQGPVILGKKRPLPGSLQTVVRSGEAPPDGQSIKIQSRRKSKNDFSQKSRKLPNIIIFK